MRGRVFALACAAGLAGSAFGQTSILKAQVWNGTAWSNNVTVPASGGAVRVRFTVSYFGTRAPIAFCATNFQPMFSHWTPSDSINLGVTEGNYTAPGIADSDFSTGSDFGRAAAFAFANMGGTSKLVAHSETIAGVPRIRVAGAIVTNAPGVGTTLNNVNGSGGIFLRQFITGSLRTPDSPPIVFGATDVPVYGVEVSVGSTFVPRTIEISQAAFGSGGSLYWFQNATEIFGTISSAPSEVALEPATITYIPTPGVAAIVLGACVTTARKRPLRKTG